MLSASAVGVLEHFNSAEHKACGKHLSTFLPQLQDLREPRRILQGFSREKCRILQRKGKEQCSEYSKSKMYWGQTPWGRENCLENMLKWPVRTKWGSLMEVFHILEGQGWLDEGQMRRVALYSWWGLAILTRILSMLLKSNMPLFMQTLSIFAAFWGGLEKGLLHGICACNFLKM